MVVLVARVIDEGVNVAGELCLKVGYEQMK
jgi:hypothetical protein